MSVTVTVEKKTALLEGTRHQNQLVSCRTSARKPVYLNRIFFSYVIKHCKFVEPHVEGTDTKWKREFCFQLKLFGHV